MIVGIIGAGKVGTTLGAYLRKNEISVSGYYSQTYESAAIAADFTKTKAYNDIDALVNASGTLFITTPDGEIRHAWDCIAKDRLAGKIICHFSGSLSSLVFSGIEAAGAFGCSVHPMFAFSDKFQSYKTFHTASLTIEGQEKAVSALRKLFEGLGHKVFMMKAEDKMHYHTAAALASNYMVGLFQLSLNLLGDCGFSEEDSRALLAPLVQNNVTAMLEKGTVSALTGPIERGDISTVKKHLEVLAKTDTEAVYRSLGRELVKIAQKKNADRDYTAVSNML